MRLPDWKERLAAFEAGTGGTRAEVTHTIGGRATQARVTVTIDGLVVIDETPESFILNGGGL